MECLWTWGGAYASGDILSARNFRDFLNLFMSRRNQVNDTNQSINISSFYYWPKHDGEHCSWSPFSKWRFLLEWYVPMSLESKIHALASVCVFVSRTQTYNRRKLKLGNQNLYNTERLLYLELFAKIDLVICLQGYAKNSNAWSEPD